MILHWDGTGPLSDEDEAAIRARVANGEQLIKCEMDMRNGSPPFPSFDWLLSPDELAVLAPANEESEQQEQPEGGSTVL